MKFPSPPKYLGFPALLGLALSLSVSLPVAAQTSPDSTNAARAQKPAPVNTEYGLVQGSAETGLTVYRGVPYARPPLGELRWRAPQAPESWQGVRDATQFAPDPYQGDGKGGVSEDCLYLNVWTPAKAADEKLPVLVWIYGGAFSGGGTSFPVHNGEHLARKGVVLVSINYRVGALGFLAHPELSAESPQNSSGNYGLLDMLAALKWIQGNIASFGGDPDKVTLFGESAGGISVSMLCASPEAKGLFRGAISQSGGNFGPTRPTTYPGENMRGLREAEKAGVAYAKRAGVSSLAELRKLPPEKLPAAWDSGTAWPIIDGVVITDDQYRLYEKGHYNDVAILVGYTSDEGLSFSRDRTPEEYRASTRRRYGPFAEALLQAYPTAEDRVPKTARDLMRDAAFGWPTWSWARLQKKTGKAPVYMYYFDVHPKRDPQGPDADHGTPHGVDVPYVFKTLHPGDPRLSPRDFEASELMASYWTNFAKHCDPNGEGLPEWPLFEEDGDCVLLLGETTMKGAVPSLEALKVLDQYFAWRRSAEGTAWAK